LGDRTAPALESRRDDCGIEMRHPRDRLNRIPNARYQDTLRSFTTRSRRAPCGIVRVSKSRRVAHRSPVERQRGLGLKFLVAITRRANVAGKHADQLIRRSSRQSGPRGGIWQSGVAEPAGSASSRRRIFVHRWNYLLAAQVRLKQS
jgi:hypothetical protein